MSWAQYKKRANQNSGGGGTFLKLQAGERVQCVVLGEPMESWTKKVGGGYDNAEPGEPDAWVSYMVNVVDLDERIPRILSMSPGLFKEVCAFFERFDQDRVVLITREGAALNTRWRVDNVGPLSDDDRAFVDGEAEEMFDLTQYGGRPLSVADDDVPF